MKPRKFLVIVAIIALAAVGCGGADDRADLAKIPPSSQASRDLVLASVQRKAIDQRVRATATIEPNAGAIADITSVIPHA